MAGTNNTSNRKRRWLAPNGGFANLLTAVVALWVIELIDTLILRHALDRFGIIPRTMSGLLGILLAPLLHRDFAHLLANSAPLLIAGSLIALHGTQTLHRVTLIVWLLSGSLEWALGPSRICSIGASGIVFGYIGFLLAHAVFSFRPLSIAAALLCAWFYGASILPNVLPTAHSATHHISWHGHLFGLLSGIVAARATQNPRR